MNARSFRPGQLYRDRRRAKDMTARSVRHDPERHLRSSWSETPTSIRRNLNRMHLGHYPVYNRRDAQIQFDLDFRLSLCRKAGREIWCRNWPITLAERARILCARDRCGNGCGQFAAVCRFSSRSALNFFMEAAKLRAARLLWPGSWRRFETQEPAILDAADALPDHAASACRNKNPYNNVIPQTPMRRCRRFLGARKSLHTNALDEGRLPCHEFASPYPRRNTQLILQEETALPCGSTRWQGQATMWKSLNAMTGEKAGPWIPGGRWRFGRHELRRLPPAAQLRIEETAATRQGAD